MKKLVSWNIATLLTLAMVGYCAYYLLLQDNFLHISIAAIIDQSHYLKDRKHLLVLGLLPIYIATMIFGAAMLGIYLGSVLQSWISGGTKKSAYPDKQSIGKLPMPLVRE